MVNQLVLILIQLIAVLSSLYDFYQMRFEGVMFIIYEIYLLNWRCFVISSHFNGILAYVNLSLARDENAAMERSQNFATLRQYLGWLAAIYGYPTMVGGTWLLHYNSSLAHLAKILHVGLGAIPYLAVQEIRMGWGTVRRVVRSTQGVVIFSAISHALLSYITGNGWGFCGAGLMVLNTIVMSLAPDHNYLGCSPGELYIMSLSLTSFVLCHASQDARDIYSEQFRTLDN